MIPLWNFVFPIRFRSCPYSA